MSPAAKLHRWPVHYAWVAAGVTFLTLLAAAGGRAAPGVMILPLCNEFQWSRTKVSLVISINIFIYGLIGPFAAALYQSFGLRRTMLLAMALIGTRKPAKLADWGKENPSARTGSFADTAKFADVAVFAVKGSALSEAVRSAGPENLKGKPVIDVTNPIADAPPEQGVLKFVTDLNGSMMERVQKEFPEIRFVNAFNSVGSSRMVNPQFAGGKPTMFICGDDSAAKHVVTKVLDQFGWETADMGRAIAARAIEPLCILWYIPGFLHNEWTHAFKLLK